MYRFGGVIGAIAMITLLPLLVIIFAYGCDKNGGYNPFQRFYNFMTNFDIEFLKEQVKNWSYGSAIFYFGIVLQLVVFSYALPGDEVEGAPLRDGTRLKYKINGKVNATCNGYAFSNFLILHNKLWVHFNLSLPFLSCPFVDKVGLCFYG